MTDLLREVFFCSTVIGGIVGNVTSSDNGMVFSTGAAALFASFSAAADVEADPDEEAADAEDDSESRGAVLSADSAVASSEEDAPPPKRPFSLPDKSTSDKKRIM